jgi:DNA-binding XRE family transcriptional regulator
MRVTQSVLRIFKVTCRMRVTHILWVDMEQTQVETPLRRLRKRRGLTVAEVSLAIGIDQGNLSRIERGEQFSRRAAALLVAYYGAESISELEILYPDRFPGLAVSKSPCGVAATRAKN